jgi:hypothetical protein
MTRLFLSIFFIPLTTIGQQPSSVKEIDSIISKIKKQFDTSSYEKVDGGTTWDSSYHHKEMFYLNGQLVKIIAWNKYGNWRNDMLSYYFDDKTIKFSKGESFKGYPNYGRLDFAIYYYQDNEIHVVWLTKKPDNVLGVATDVFLEWSYILQQHANKLNR